MNQKNSNMTAEYSQILQRIIAIALVLLIDQMLG